MSKARMIEDWLAMGLSDQEIAETMQCRRDYVRAVRHRRNNREATGVIATPRQRATMNAWHRARRAKQKALEA